MSFMQVAHAIRARLGPGTDMLVTHDDGVTIEWDTGSIDLVLVTDDEDRSDPGFFSIYYTRRDSFGNHGSASLFRLPRSSTPDQLAHGLLIAMHAERTNTAIPSPWRWGLLAPTMTTAFADELADRGITNVSVTDTVVSAKLERRDGSTCSAFIRWDSHERLWNSLLRIIDEEELVGGKLYRDFTPLATPTLIAKFVSYWFNHTDSDFNPLPLDHAHPFPLARVGLDDGTGAGLDQVIEAVHRRGYEVLRVDLAESQPVTGVVGFADVISFRDEERRFFTLTRGHGDTAVWMLHALVIDVCNEDADSQNKTNLLSIQQPWVLDAPNAYALPVASTTPTLIADSITTLIQSLPATGAPQSLLSRDLVFLTQSNFRFALLELEEATARDLGMTESIAIPAPALIRTPHDAEQMAAAWMRVLGFPDAAATPIGPDEGIDVSARAAVAQVKTETVAVGRPAIQQLAGVAHGAGKQGLFFSLSGYKKGAVEWAEQVDMPLFEFDYQGIPQPANDAAVALLLSNGIPTG